MRKLKPCPLCGDRHIYRCRSVTSRWKRWWLQCRYCNWTAEHAHTLRGAMRKWNRSTTVVEVYERKADNDYQRKV